MTTELQVEFIQTQYLSIILLAVLIFWNHHRKNKFQLRMSRSRSSSGSITEDHKIIIAIEIENLIVECSNKKKSGFLPLEIKSSDETALSKFKKLFGYGAYYKPMSTKTKIKQFLNALQSLPDVQLFLYTSLQKAFAQQLLQKLNIQDCFPIEYRRYALDSGLKLNEKKHPSWVDHNTRRVMIVTPNREDYDEQYKKYFLPLHNLKKEKLMKSSLNLIRRIIQSTSNSDELHAEMDEYKAQIQSDYQNEEVTSQ